jgi:hypothetical protein
MVIGSISTKEANIDPTSLVPANFQKWAPITIKKVTAKLPDHELYKYAIDIQGSETLACEPCHALRQN